MAQSCNIRTPLLTTDRKVRIDKDGLVLWRCFRGTGNTESSHGQFTRAFGHKQAGPMYSVSVLINHHFRQSWRASQRHRPNFPRIHHYDGALVDSVNASYLRLLGKLRYDGWPNFDEGVPVYQSPFGIIPHLDEPGLPRGAPSKHLKPSLRYVAWAIQCVLPCTPVATKEERILFKRLLEELLAGGYSISTDAFFHELCKRWNEDYIVLPPRSKPKKGEEFEITIFPKYVGHLTRHYKAWRVNQKKRVAIAIAASSDVLRALQHNTGVRVPTDFEAQVVPVEPVMQSASPRAEQKANESEQIPPTVHLAPLPYFQVHHALQAPLAWGVPPFHHHTASQTKKRARKVCPNCNNSDCNAPYTGRLCAGTGEN